MCTLHSSCWGGWANGWASTKRIYTLTYKGGQCLTAVLNMLIVLNCFLINMFVICPSLCLLDWMKEEMKRMSNSQQYEKINVQSTVWRANGVQSLVGGVLISHYEKYFFGLVVLVGYWHFFRSWEIPYWFVWCFSGFSAYRLILSTIDKEHDVFE